MTASAQKPAPLHDAHCDIWAVPQMSSPDVLIAAGYDDEAVVSYLADISPIYAALCRIVAQFGGILLLAMNAKQPALSLDHQMWTTACDQLAEASERLQAIKPPAEANQHFKAMGHLATELQQLAKDTDALSVTRDAAQRHQDVMTILQRLQSIQKLLVGTAVPSANITPVDFSHACCTCGASARSRQHSDNQGGT